MNLEPITLVNLAPIEVPVTIDGEEFVLREASTGAHIAYKNLCMMATKFDSNMKPIGLAQGLADAEALLVSGCLFYKKTGQAVPLATIRSWPSRLVAPLFKRAKELSGIDKEEEAAQKTVEERAAIQEAETKKSCSSTEDTSA